MNNDPYLNKALEVARLAGRLIIRYFQLPERLKASKGSDQQWTSRAHTEAAELMTDQLSDAYPGHQVQSLHTKTYNPRIKPLYRWCLDPIVGSHNFVSGIPHFSISMALLEESKISRALIYDPLTGACATAVLGQGSHAESIRLRVRERSTVHEPIICFERGSRCSSKQWQSYVDYLRKVKPNAVLRQGGCSALAMLALASGRVDGCCFSGLRFASLAAATLVVTEAGGLVQSEYTNKKKVTSPFWAASPWSFTLMKDFFNYRQ